MNKWIKSQFLITGKVLKLLINRLNIEKNIDLKDKLEYIMYIKVKYGK